MPSATQGDLLRQRFAEAGQEHVFAGERDLGEGQRERLHAALASIDLGLVAEFQRLIRAPSAVGAKPPRFEPADVFPLRRGPVELAEERRARERGDAMLRAGSVGWLLVAGGQASRLGHDAPKGCLPVTPLTGTSLYELFARKLLAARARHGAVGPWYVMTSEATDAPTKEFFERERWFGLDPDDVVFFRQAMVPALDSAGRILMAAPDAPFLAPNGHGGLLSALATSGALAHAAARGARMSSKVVKKRDAAEKVGVLGRVDGMPTCIEYSDLPAPLRDARDARGELVFWAGNIALHVLDRVFVEELTRGGLRLPWHVARKRIPVVSAAGVRAEVEGYKFEAFVFDALGVAGTSVALEVAREREFSPVKNKDGEDSVRSARRDQCRLFAGWAARAGVALPPPDAEGLHRVEVDPRFAEDEAEFLARLPASPRVIAGGHLYAP